MRFFIIQLWIAICSDDLLAHPFIIYAGNGRVSDFCDFAYGICIVHMARWGELKKFLIMASTVACL